MRYFSSYGPVDPKLHFCVERRELVDRCVGQLIGDGDKGHFFTIWAPRQTGKTWLMERAIAEIDARYGEQFRVGTMSMQGVILEDNDPDEAFFEQIPDLFYDAFDIDVDVPATWAEWARMFHRKRGLFDCPVLLLIDEFDALPQRFIDMLVALFRDMYLRPRNYRLHGLALIGVRAVLGVGSQRGSPFNVQHSLKVDNLTESEVNKMFDQYQGECGQVVEPAVRSAVYEATRGQPGLVSWFGELLTEKYNPGKENSIALSTWQRLYPHALRTEWSNNVLNLLAKAREREAEVLGLFANSRVPFSIHQEWCNFLYLNGVIDFDDPTKLPDSVGLFCRFASPFVQECLYTALTDDLFGARGPILALRPGDALEDVFFPEGLNLPSLLSRYQCYLERLAAEGFEPLKDAPRRADRNIAEAVGHFHLYAWLREAVGNYVRINPEFPTGNGHVDLVVQYEETKGVIEVKSFRNMLHLQAGQEQAAGYARQLGLEAATVALFVHTRDKEELEALNSDVVIDGVRVVTLAIGWG